MGEAQARSTSEIGLQVPLAIPGVDSIFHPHGWRMDVNMAGKIHEFRPKPADSEKITINLGYVDLGQIDLLVQESFYSNRTDFIRTAIRNQLDRHNDTVKRSVARHQLDLGLRQYSRQDLETVRAAGETLHIQVCPSSDNLRLIRLFAKGGSGSSGVRV
jgi:Arc/MetJ-type ribon-helix-helix transcriptional regulator